MSYNIAEVSVGTAQETENENDDCEYGYLYCVSNSSMPGILNIGMSWTPPELRMMTHINETLGLWHPPTQYNCEFSKKVRNLEYKKGVIYKLLAQYRINPIRKFFRISLEYARALFDLMDGEYGDNGRHVSNEEDNEEAECSNWNIPIIEERLEKRVAEIKAIEKKMLDCLFKKSDDLTANLNKIEENLEERKMELKEINEVIEKRKAELASLDTSSITEGYVRTHPTSIPTTNNV